MARKRLLTRKEVADRLRVSVKTLDRRISSRQFPPGFSDGGEHFWLEEDVEAYLHLRSRMGESPDLDPEKVVPDE